MLTYKWGDDAWLGLLVSVHPSSPITIWIG